MAAALQETNIVYILYTLSPVNGQCLQGNVDVKENYYQTKCAVECYGLFQYANSHHYITGDTVSVRDEHFQNAKSSQCIYKDTISVTKRKSDL